MPDEAAPFPRWYFSIHNIGGAHYGGRLFASQEELDAAGGAAVWKGTPQDAAAAAPVAATPPAAGPRLSPELYTLLRRSFEGGATADEQTLLAVLLPFLDEDAHGRATPADALQVEAMLSDFGLTLVVQA